VFTHLMGLHAPALNDLLSQWGFRRSQNIAYRPSCETCDACISVRVLVDEFAPSRGFKRIIKRNRDLVAEKVPAEASLEQYDVFRGYLDGRHTDGGMTDMTLVDYAMMVEETAIDTTLIEYRIRQYGDAFDDQSGETNGANGDLVAVALTDTLEDGLSMVYSFYNPHLQDRSLGSFMILEHIERTRKLGLPYLYLGFWVEGSRKMHYKSRFTPQEHLGRSGWVRQT
ncbi:MAG: arginyltransferase, partial [Fimbriimonadaceae bacterium]|nr:arginyltransferase [Alphaproteobacteria bacterium]